MAEENVAGDNTEEDWPSTPRLSFSIYLQKSKWVQTFGTSS